MDVTTSLLIAAGTVAATFTWLGWWFERAIHNGPQGCDDCQGLDRGCVPCRRTKARLN